MWTRCSRSVTLVVFAVAGISSAWAEGLPEDQKVAYLIHAVASDPNSPVTFEVTLSLEARGQAGTVVGWTVTGIEFHQLGVGGASDRAWTESQPIVPTADGLWWVQHADPQAPQAAEFSTPPVFAGQAASPDPEGNSLDYVLGGTPGEPGGTSPWPTTTVLSHEFTVVGDPGPLTAADEEPVEVEPRTGPPVGGA